MYDLRLASPSKAGRDAISKLNIALTRATSVACLTLPVGLAGCGGAQSALEVHGPGAASIAGLWWFMLAAALLVYGTVLAFLVVAVRRKRDDSPSDGFRSVLATRPLRSAIAASVLILGIVYLLSERASAVLHTSHEPDALVIRVVGWQWWWQVRYADGNTSAEVITANEIHIPVARRVRVELTSGDVIHSFWVPHLQGKMDLVPGRTNVMWMQADRPATSRGQCAEYCGVQHSQMALHVVAQSPDAFDAWLAYERRSAVPPTDSLGQLGAQVFAQAGRAYCHMVRGTNSLGRFGPDLTHLAARQTLAAGTLANTAANLSAWIVGAQRIKPGNRMPNVPLTDARLRALVHYLMSLK